MPRSRSQATRGCSGRGPAGFGPAPRRRFAGAPRRNRRDTRQVQRRIGGGGRSEPGHSLCRGRGLLVGTAAAAVQIVTFPLAASNSLLQYLHRAAFEPPKSDQNSSSYSRARKEKGKRKKGRGRGRNRKTAPETKDLHQKQKICSTFSEH